MFTAVALIILVQPAIQRTYSQPAGGCGVTGSGGLEREVMVRVYFQRRISLNNTRLQMIIGLFMFPLGVIAS